MSRSNRIKQSGKTNPSGNNAGMENSAPLGEVARSVSLIAVLGLFVCIAGYWALKDGWIGQPEEPVVLPLNERQAIYRSQTKELQELLSDQDYRAAARAEDSALLERLHQKRASYGGQLADTSTSGSPEKWRQRHDELELWYRDNKAEMAPSLRQHMEAKLQALAGDLPR